MILVTGAGGSNGSELIKQLSATGGSVRAMFRRRRDHKNDALPGVEVVTADFDDLASINRALEGAQSAFLVTNSSERAETQQLSFVEAARATGLRHIVYLSQSIDARGDGIAALGNARQAHLFCRRFGGRNARCSAFFRNARVAGRWPYRGLRSLPSRRSIRHLHRG